MFSDISKRQVLLLPERTLRCSPAALASLLNTSTENLPLACEKASEEDPSIASHRPNHCMIGVAKLAAMEQMAGRPSFQSEEVLDKDLLIALFGGSEEGIYCPSLPLRFAESSFSCVLYFSYYEVYPKGK